jgi:hypothetical protein
MNRLAAGLFALALGCSAAVRADFRDRPVFDVHSKRSPAATDTRIPIRGPIVISQSGDYVVANNLAATPESPAIQFLNTENIVVTIDLNGQTVTASDQDAILVNPRNGSWSRCVDLTLSNGTVSGNVKALGWADRCGWSQVKIDHVTLDRSHVYVEDATLSITASRLMESFVSTYGNFAAPLLKIVGNHFSDSGLDLTGHGEIPGNIFHPYGFIDLGRNDDMGTGSFVVAGNDIAGGEIRVGVDPSQSVGSIQVLRNHVGSVVLWNAWYSVVEGNIIYRCTSPFGYEAESAITAIYAFFNRIDNNQFLGACEYGIHFGEVTSGNRYSGNRLRDLMPMPVLDEGEDNGPRVDVAPQQ